MRNHKIVVLILAVLIVLALLANTVAFVVDETRDITLVTRFSKINRVIDGRTDPGLHWKWPWPIENTVVYDSRNHVLVTPYRPMNNAEKYNIMMAAYCTWRIANPEQFYAAKKTVAGASQAIQDLLSSEMTSVIGNVRMDELVNTDPKKGDMSQIEDRIRQRVEVRAMDDYGVELTNVGFKRLGLPQSITKAVTDAMSSERQEEIDQLKAEGQAIADAIVARATAAREKILEFTRRKAGDIRTEGETRAAEAYEAFSENPEFSMFLRSIESLQQSLQNRTTFLLDSRQMPILRWLRVQPSLETFKSVGPKPADSDS